jgi:hypothetical protein
MNVPLLLCGRLTSVPMTSSCKILFLANRPAEPVSVPEEVAILVGVLEDGPVRGPLHPLVRHHVLSVAVGVGGTEDVKGLTDDWWNSESLS